MRSSRSALARRAAGWAAAALLVLFAACSDQAPIEPSGSDGQLSVQEVGPALAAQKSHTPELMADGNVVGTAVGRTDDGRPSVVLYLLRGGVEGLPDHLDGIPVEHVVTGMFVAGADPQTRARPAPVGYSVGHPDITAGTYGARVSDGTTIFMLSNNHVFANVNQASNGDPILQPGPSDGGSDPADRIALLSDYEPISFSSDNTIDAAIAEAVYPDSVLASTPTDDGYGAPSPTLFELDSDGDGNVDSGVIGTAVQKYGRTTGLTMGEVSEISVTAEVCYVCANPVCTRCAESATMVDQIGITPGDFSDGGDSGSLIVTSDANRNPLGLLFAGSSSRTLANRIDLVLDRFGVSIDDGSGDDGGTSNSAPTASFTYSPSDPVIGESVSFDGTGSSDSDGNVQSYDWDFGDDATGSGSTTSHSYSTSGNYTVTLTVTDDDGATDSSSQTVSVADSGTGIELSASGQKVRGVRTVDLAWSGAGSTDVDVYRDGSLVVTTPNDGEHTEDLGRGGGGTFTYQVCEAGTETCSNEASVTF